MSTCRSCGAQVIWARNTTTGKNAPIDALPASNGNVVLTECPETGADLYLIAGPEHQGEQLHTSHFATCPNAKKHRRR